jgi:cytochrome c oxidase assembly protein subunit 15
VTVARLVDRLRGWLDRNLRGLAVASLVVNVLIVVTGGVVRLTDSGLGCPTWPRCTDDSFTPHGAMTLHSAIEFGNRMVTFLIAAVAIATFAAAWRSGRTSLRRLALALALGVPAQAVVGGITVLTDLNPWIVALHLLVSLAMICVAVVLLRRVDEPDTDPVPTTADGVRWLAWAATLLLVVELAQGVIGFTQYFTGLPVVLVGLHLLGAALTAAALTWLVLGTRDRLAAHPDPDPDPPSPADPPAVTRSY